MPGMEVASTNFENMPGRSHQCEVCNKCFSHMSVLKTHRQTHTAGKPYKCVLCYKTFAGRGSLTNHLIAHTGVKQYQCLYCKKAFMRKEHLQCHIRIHTGYKPYKCEVCHKHFATASHRKVHMRNHTGERPFKCELCPKRFICSSGLKTHMFSHTGEKPYMCKVCYRRFSGGYLLKKHMRSHEYAEPFAGDTSEVPANELPPLPALEPIKCPENMLPLVVHGNEVCNNDSTHPAENTISEIGREYCCDFCRRIFPNPILLRLHLVKIHTTDKAHLCELCLKGFPSVRALQWHKKRDHHDSVMSDSRLVENMARYVSIPPHDQSRNEGDYDKPLDLHIARLENGEKSNRLLCNECQTTFDDTESFEGHRWLCLKEATDRIAVKIRDQPMSFPLIGDTCVSSSEVRLSQSPIAGDDCLAQSPGSGVYVQDDTFFAAMDSFKLSVERLVSSSSSPRLRHSSGSGSPQSDPGRHSPPEGANGFDEAIAPAPDSHVCDVCQKVFSSTSRLRTHKTVHTTARPFKCHVCGKTFKGRGSLHNHMMVHREIKPFRCQVCDKTFTRKEHLHIHFRLHTGDKPYSCSYCSKRFATASHMKVHVRNHTGERPFQCDICDKNFTSSSLLKGHKKREHCTE